MMVFNCKACGKPIVFITTVAGKKMPCDAMVRAYEPDADGPDTIITKDGQTVRGRVLAPAADGGKLQCNTVIDGQSAGVLAPAADGGKLGRIPHWASCPGAAGLRKTRNPK